MNDNSKPCFICSEVADKFSEKSLQYFVECSTCGKYTISRETADFISQHVSSRHLVSGCIRDANKRGDSPEITPELIKEFESHPTIPKTVVEQIDRFIVHLGRSSSYISDRVPYDLSKDYPIIYAKRAAELDSIVDHLEKTGIIEKQENKYLILTIDGVRRFQEMATRRVESTQAFVAMSFKPELIKSAYKQAIKLAIQECGYDPVNLAEVEHTGKIDDRIIAEIRKSRFLVADFTEHKGGVYFEAGFALGLNIPVIWCCSEEDKKDLHFDTRQYNHIFWIDANDLYERLKNRIEATII